VTSETYPPQAALLRRAWFEVAGSVAPQLADLPALLDARLADLEAGGTLGEPGLLAIAEDASQYAMEQGAGDVARTLSKRLRRAIYEFLLALDAVNPAELAPTGAVPVPPALSPAPPPPAAAEPRVPVALLPDDVQGGDEAPAAAEDEPAESVEASTVPLWEQVSTPAPAREVYRVASREVIPVTDAAPTETAEPQASEVGPEAVAPESALDAATAAEDDRDIEAFTAEVFDGAAQDVEADWTSTPEAAVSDQAPDPAGAVLDTGWEAPSDAALHVEEVEVAEPDAQAEAFEPETAVEEAAQPGAEAVAETDAEVWGDEPVAEVVEPVAEAEFEAPVAGAAEGDTPVAWDAPPAPASTWAPVVDVPPAPPAEDEAGPGATPNGVKPPRDLLRVPRQFRRLPPLPARQHPDTEPALPSEPPAVAWTTPAAEAAEAPTAESDAEVAQSVESAPAAALPAEPEAVAPVDFTDELTAVEDDDLFGVPALPWPADDRAEATAVEPEAVAAEVAPEPEEELGLPFSPLADAEAAAAEHAPVALPEEPAPLPHAPELLAESAAQPVAELDMAPAAAQPFVDPFAPVAPAAEQPVEYPDLPTSAPVGGGQPWPPVPIAPSAAPFPIAPREGFHLTDPGVLDLPEAEEEPLPAPPAENPFTAAIPPVNVPPRVSSAPAAPPAAPAPAPTAAESYGEQDDAGAWRVRQSPRAQLLAERMAQKRREEAARAAFEAAAVPEEGHHHGRKKRRGEDTLPDLGTARRQLDEHLRRKRGAEAAALLQRLAQELGGREIADLALDAGDRCRALGQSRSATNCYLAAWRADPLYETPLWRLSDVCLNEQEIDLAVGYLERIADLMRSRGDDEGAIGVYRKIAMIAPERQDVRDVIRLAKTTGRLDV